MIQGGPVVLEACVTNGWDSASFSPLQFNFAFTVLYCRIDIYLVRSTMSRSFESFLCARYVSPAFAFALTFTVAYAYAYALFSFVFPLYFE